MQVPLRYPISPNNNNLAYVCTSPQGIENDIRRVAICVNKKIKTFIRTVHLCESIKVENLQKIIINNNQGELTNTSNLPQGATVKSGLSASFFITQNNEGTLYRIKITEISNYSLGTLTWKIFFKQSTFEFRSIELTYSSFFLSNNEPLSILNDKYWSY